MIYLYVFIFGFLLCFSRFYGVCASAVIPQFALAADPTLYPGDIYVHGSVMVKTTYFYQFLKLFGPLADNTYFHFVFYCIVSLAHIYFIFKIVDYLFPELKEHQVGLIALFMFLYDHPLFAGAYHQLVNVHSFRQTIATTPFIAASLYCFLKNRYLLAITILSIFAIPLHFRSAWIYAAVVFSYMLFFYKKVSLRQIVFAVMLLFVSFGILLWYKGQMQVDPMTFDQKLEIFKIVKERYADEGSPFMNTKADFIKLILLIVPALMSIRFLKRREDQIKVYWFFGVTLATFILGGIYCEYFYQKIPSIEIFSLGFPQLVTYPILFSFFLIAGALLRLVVNDRNKLSWIYITALFALAYWPNMKLKSILIYLGCIGVSYILIKGIKTLPERMKLKPLTAWMFIAVILFLFIKDIDRIRESYAAKSNSFPLYVYLFERDSYECQLWAKEQSLRNSVFLPLREEAGSLYFDDFFRKYSARTLFFGDVASVMHSYSLVEEHYGRKVFLDSLINLVMEGRMDEVNDLVKSRSWKIDYLMIPKKYSLNLPVVYTNDTYNIYSLGT